MEGIERAFLSICCTLHIGYPNRLRNEQGSVFSLDKWKQLTNPRSIKFRFSGVEEHSSLGIGENYHSALRRIYRNIRFAPPQLTEKFSVNVAVKVVNDTMSENGLVLTRLVYGDVPRFPIINTELPNQKDRLEAIKTAQAEMNAIVAERRIRTALAYEITPPSDRIYKVGEEVHVCSENRIDCIGPLRVESMQGRMVTVQSLGGDRVQTFNYFQLKTSIQDCLYKLQNDLFSKTLHPEIIYVLNPHGNKFDVSKKQERARLINRYT